MIETAAARRRAEQQEELALTASWLTAVLQRAKKVPTLKKLLSRPGAKSDIGHYLAGAKVTLPAMTVSDWRAARSSAQTPE